MSDPTDKELDEYLKGGSPVSQHYREMEADAVPPDVDRRVLAQARAAVAKRRPAKSRAWMRWTAPLALAASAVMVVSIVIESGVQKETVLTADKPTADVAGGRDNAAAESKGEVRSMWSPPSDAAEPAPLEYRVMEAPAAPPAAKAEIQSAPQPATPEEITASAKRMRSEMQDSVAPIVAVDPALAPATEPEAAAIFAPAPAPAPVAAAAPPSTAIQQTTSIRPDRRSSDEQSREYDLSEVTVTGSRRRAPPTAGPRNTVPASNMSGATAEEPARDEARTQSDPERWLADIRQLRKEGKTAEADLEWERFRVAFPKYVVAEDDVASKKQ